MQRRMLFGGKKRTVKPVLHPYPAAAHDPFTAIPMVAPKVREEQDADGALTLVHTVPVPTRYARFLGRFLGRERVSRTILDTHGTFFWRQIDGIRPLNVIADTIRRHTSQPDAQARKAVIAFTRDLMKRNLVVLKIPD